MGLSATTYAYGLEDGLATRENVKAIVGVQPLPYKEFVDAFGLPGFLQRAGEKVSKERVGFAMSEKTFLPDAAKVTVPTLVVQNRNDPWTSLDVVQAYYDALAVEKDVMWLELSKDRAASCYLGTHPEFLSSWFDRFIRNPERMSKWFLIGVAVLVGLVIASLLSRSRCTPSG